MPETTGTRCCSRREGLPVAGPYTGSQERPSGAKYYERMRELGCFTCRMSRRWWGERSAVTYLVNDYQRRGYIDRIHRNLYTVMDVETGEPMLNRYQIGSRLFSGCLYSPAQRF